MLNLCEQHGSVKAPSAKPPSRRQWTNAKCDHPVIVGAKSEHLAKRLQRALERSDFFVKDDLFLRCESEVFAQLQNRIVCRARVSSVPLSRFLVSVGTCGDFAKSEPSF
jgi:hypothetical protein